MALAKRGLCAPVDTRLFTDFHGNANITRNQYASPPRGNAIPAGPFSDFDKNLFLC